MVELTKKVHCGTVIVDISKQNDKYKVLVTMKKFGDCAAYNYIGFMTQYALNEGKVSPSEFANLLKTKYNCKIGDAGCIKVVGECLEEFIKSED